MNSAELFCPNITCPARGAVGKGNIGVHSEKTKRYICHVCEQTFSASKGTLFYRLRTDPQTVLLVIALLVYGCPIQAIVQAFGFDERTVRSWWQRAGHHCQAFHERLVEDHQLDLGQVQADEIKAKTQRGPIWVAMAMMVSTRLWLGGAVSASRDTALLQKMAQPVRAIALCRPLLIAVDGLNLYPNVFRDAFRTGIPRLAGQIGRMTLVEWPNIAIVQVVKSKIVGTWNIQRIVVQGTKSMVEQLLQTTQGGGVTPAPTAGAVSILPTSNGLMAPSASAWLACSAAPGISLAKAPVCNTACISSAASTTSVTFTKACVSAFL
jgi:transposase-like protein